MSDENNTTADPSGAKLLAELIALTHRLADVDHTLAGILEKLENRAAALTATDVPQDVSNIQPA